MGLWSRIKAAVSNRPYLNSSIRIHEGMGRGGKPRPFNADAAIRQFNHWAYAAAMCNANAVANVPLRLYSRKREGRKLYKTQPVPAHARRRLASGASRIVAQKVATFSGDLEEVIEPHPALKILQAVNPWQNGYELTVLRMVDLQATGNSYLHVVGDKGGTPAELWRMPPQWTRIMPSRDAFIEKYVYGVPPEEKDFAPEDLIHFKMPNPADLHYGKGWFEAAWSAIGLHDSKRSMDVAKFDNMARPDWLLSVKAPITKDKLDQFEESVKQKLRGAKAGSFLTINGDISATPLNLDVPEVGTATRIIEEISAVSGVPVAMLLSNDPSKAGSMTARAGWYRNTIRPYCRLDEEKLNEKWLPMFDGAEDLVLAYDLVSFEDDEAQAKRLIGLVAGGILRADEARAEMGYDTLGTPEATTLYPPSGTTGGAAAVSGDLAVGQNDDRQNESVMN